MPEISGDIRLKAAVSASGELSASVGGNGAVNAEIASDGNLAASMADQIVVKADAEYPYYTGQTHVIPAAREGKVLETADHILTENVSVAAIPYYETSNTHGTTVIIGG